MGNSCTCCAERRLLKELHLQARRQGVHPPCLAHWIHRKYGDLVVSRVRRDGGIGTSLPCVICRKILDKNSIQWRAHIGPVWVRSTDPDVPKSKPTNKQKHKLGFK
jgi:hypothetical protein